MTLATISSLVHRMDHQVQLSEKENDKFTPHLESFVTQVNTK